MEKKFVLKVDNKMTDYLQRLQLDIDTRLSVIDRLFVNHKDDQDTSLFDSVPWKKYNKELQEVQAEYNQAKDEFSKKIIPMVSEKTGITVDDLMFNWRIDDFTSGEVNIDLINE